MKSVSHLRSEKEALMKKVFTAFIILLVLLGANYLGSTPSNKLLHFMEEKISWDDLKLINLKIEQDSKNHKILSLSPRNIDSTLLTLDFENKKSPGNLDSSNYFRGKQSARFNGKSDLIEIPRGKSSLFLEPEIREPFYISIFVNPSSQSGSAILLNKSIFRSGQEFGFRLSLEQSKLELWIDRMIQTESGILLSTKLNSQHSIPPRKWSHIILEFAPAKNLILLYINGLETARYDGLAIAKDRVTGFSFHPDDTTPLYLGRNFYGNMDELLIASGTPNASHLFAEYMEVDLNLDSKFVSQALGIGLSPVYKTDISHAYLSKFSMDSKLPKNSIVEVWFRSSLYPFGAYESEYKKGLAWRRLKENELDSICNSETVKSESSKPCFTYYQWKFVLRSDPEGFHSPSVSNFKYKVNHNLPPKKITGLKFNEVASNLDEPKICMSWVASEEENVWNGGGYILYYGFKENEVAGTIHYHNANNRKKELLPNAEKLNLKDEAKSTRVSIISSCVDNGILLKNAESIEPEKNLPFLRPGITTYFWVSATNSFWSENGPGKDQISPKSKPISVTIPTKGQ